MPTGDITLKTSLDTEPVVNSLAKLKKMVQAVFKGVDTAPLESSLRDIVTDIKTVEDITKKTQAELDKLMSGAKTPESIKELEKELAEAVKKEEQLGKAYNDALDRYNAGNKRLFSATGKDITSKEDLKNIQALEAEVERLGGEIDKATQRTQGLNALLRTLKQNPSLTPEAQQLTATLEQQKSIIDRLKERYQETSDAYSRGLARNNVETKNFGEGLKRVESRLLRLAKRVLFFSVFTMALRKLRTTITNLAKSDDVLSDSLAQIKGSLATAFGIIWTTALPAIRALIHWLAVAVQYVASFLSWLTGKSFKAGREAFEAANKSAAGTAANTGKIGKAAKKTAKELQRMMLPFDQMNVLSDNSKDGGGSGGGGGSGAGAGGIGTIWPDEMDETIGKLENFRDLVLLIGAAFASWKISKYLAPLIQWTRGKTFIWLTALIYGIFEFAAGLREWIKEGPTVTNVLRTIGGGILALGAALKLLGVGGPLGIILTIIGLVILAFKRLYNSSEKFRAWVDKFVKLFKEKKFRELGKHIIDGIKNGIWNGIKKIGSWLKKKVFDPIVKGIKRVFGISSPAKKMMDIGKMILLGILEGMLAPIKTIGTWIKEKILEPIKNALFGASDDEEGMSLNITLGLVDKFSSAWNAVKGVWEGIKTRTASLTAALVNSFSAAWSKIKGVWESVKARTANLTTALVDRFSAAWNKIKNVWNKIGNKKAEITLSFKEKMKAAYNKIANAIQSARKRWPATRIILPDIHPLAKGAVIPPNKQFLAMMGDQKRGVNIETPLQTMIDAFNTALKSNGLDGNTNVNVYLQGDAGQLFKVVRTEANRYTQSTGKAAFIL